MSKPLTFTHTEIYGMTDWEFIQHLKHKGTGKLEASLFDAYFHITALEVDILLDRLHRLKVFYKRAKVSKNSSIFKTALMEYVENLIPVVEAKAKRKMAKLEALHEDKTASAEPKNPLWLRGITELEGISHEDKFIYEEKDHEESN